MSTPPSKPAVLWGGPQDGQELHVYLIGKRPPEDIQIANTQLAEQHPPGLAAPPEAYVQTGLYTLDDHGEKDPPFYVYVWKGWQ